MSAPVLLTTVSRAALMVGPLPPREVVTWVTGAGPITYTPEPWPNWEDVRTIRFLAGVSGRAALTSTMEEGNG